MANGGGFAQGLADGINGAIKGYMMRRDMDRQDKEDAYRAEQQAAERQDRLDKQVEKQQLQQAGQPLAVNEGTDTTGQVPLMQAGQYSVGGQTTYDPAAAQATAAAGNTPDGMASRQVAVLRGLGKPLEAAQLESANTQTKAAKFKLDKEQEEFVNQKWDTELGTLKTPDAVAAKLSGTPIAGGRRVTAAPAPDGKTVDLIAHNEDGSTERLNAQPIQNSEEGVARLVAGYSKGMSAKDKAVLLHSFAQLDETRRHNTVDETRQEAQQQETVRHNKSTEANAEAQVGVARAHLGIAQADQKLRRDKYDADLKNDPEYVLPASVKLTVRSLDDQIKMHQKAILDATASGMADPKGVSQMRVALARLQEQRDAALKPFMPDAAKAPEPAGGAAADPWGIRAGVQGAQPPKTAAAPAPQPVAATRGIAPAAAAAPAAPAPAPAAAPSPARDPLLSALGADGNSAIAQITAQKAPAIRQAADAVRAASAQFAAVAKSGDQNATAAAMQQFQAASAQFNDLIKPYAGKEQDIRAAVGL